MKKLLFVFVIISASFFTFAQSRRYISTAKFQPYTYEELAAPVMRATNFANQKIDEYFSLLDKATEALLDKDNPRLSLYYAERALAYVKTYDFIPNDQKYQIYYMMGVCYQVMGDFQNARQYYWWAYNNGKGLPEAKQSYDNLVK